MTNPLLTVALKYEQDVVVARQRARQISNQLGFDGQDQTRIATAVSEIARNAYRYAGGGKVEFALDGDTSPQLLVVKVSDKGPGITDVAHVLSGQYRSNTGMGIGLIGAHRLMDRVEIRTAPGEGTDITLRKILPPRSPLVTTAHIGRIIQELTTKPPVGPTEELQQQNQELIRALSRLLLDRSDGELSGEQEKQVGFISKAADDLTELVNDLLDLAKIEAGKTEVRPVEFSVANLFSALRGMLRPLLVSEDVKLVFEDPPETLLVYNDEGKVSQILRNFISNAIKFTERGEVRVSAELTADGRSVALTVADTGIGIRPEDQTRIFEEFTQVANPLQGRVKGTGLGLPLCRRLARLMQGEVSMSSEFGAGSTFRTTLPVHFDERGASPAASTVVEVEVDASLLPVLVIEDEPETQFIYGKLLQGSRYQGISARNLREAREALSRIQPRAVLLDILLRGENSWRWLTDLKQSAGTASIPVIVATNTEDERKARALGADGFCQKPLSRGSLLAALDALVGRDVLVIDDDPASRYLLQKLLTDERTRVTEAVDGRSGLQAARRSRPDMIFLDLQLPDSSGEDILGALRRDSSLRETPVAIVTSRSLSAEDRQRLGVRAQAVLQKNELNAAQHLTCLAQIAGGNPLVP